MYCVSIYKNKNISTSKSKHVYFNMQIVFVVKIKSTIIMKRSEQLFLLWQMYTKSKIKYPMTNILCILQIALVC